jgi:hypothetical protein
MVTWLLLLARKRLLSGGNNLCNARILFMILLLLEMEYEHSGHQQPDCSL